MILPKIEGDLGVKDLPIITRSSYLKRVPKCWDCKDSIFAKWVQKQYIRSGSLAGIPSKLTIDSIFWKSFMASRENIETCLKCRADSNVTWKSGIPLRTLGTIVETLKERSHKDPIAEGTWSHMPKFSIMLWRFGEWNGNTLTPYKDLEIKEYKHQQPACYAIPRMRLEHIFSLVVPTHGWGPE